MISVGTEQINCNIRPSENSTIAGTHNRLITTSRITCSDSYTCNSVFRFLQTCPNTIPAQINVNLMEYWNQLCPNTIDGPLPASDPPIQITNDCPTSPTNEPTSSISTLNTESQTKLSSQISKLTDERDGLMVAVVSLGALVGILLVLLAVMTSVWVWTCWTMKRNKATTSEHVRYGITSLVALSPGHSPFFLSVRATLKS